MANEMLFSAFPPATREQWEAVIQKELKDKAPDSLQVPVEGESLSPFHMSGEGLEPGTRRRGVKRTGNTWRATVEIGPWEEGANARLLEELMGGIDGVHATGDVMDRLPEMLQDVMLGAVDLQLASSTRGVLQWILDKAKEQGVPEQELSLFIPWPDANVAEVDALLRSYPRVRLSEVDDLQHGHSIPRLAIERGREQLRFLLGKGLRIDDACARIQFKFKLGDDLFSEVARLRAFREAWAAVVEEFKPQHDCSHNTWIQAVVVLDSARTDTPPYTNVIRATLQAISAIVGGCDGLTIPTPKLPEGDVLARRVVRNIHNLLRDESFLGRVADPIGGSYTIEQLTTTMANALTDRESASQPVAVTSRNVTLSAVDAAVEKQQ
ncbi:MAG: hypothetical protein JNM91_01915, partial [Flavobacteriales bacterium]|nr:hypothetical protein [Flavobacteriales bacterium]